MKDYQTQARERWQGTRAYDEYTEKTAGYTKKTWKEANDGLTKIIKKFAKCKKGGFPPESAQAQEVVKQLQSHITEYFYTCDNKILASLGQMYVADDRFKNNFGKYGADTAQFASHAIEIYCESAEG